MSHAREIHETLIERDIDAFVSEDWEMVRPDFDAEQFTGYSADSGAVLLRYPTLETYRDSWLEQAASFRGLDRVQVARQLHEAQRLERVDASDGRALVTKIFDGVVDGPAGPKRLAWTTYYFLRFHEHRQRWLIIGFVGYLPSEWNAR